MPNYPVPNSNPGYPYREGGGPLIKTWPLPSQRPLPWNTIRFACPALNGVWAAGGFQANVPVLDPDALDPQVFLEGQLVLDPDGRRAYVVMVSPYTPSGNIQQDIMNKQILPLNPTNMVYMQYQGGAAVNVGDIIADGEFLYYSLNDMVLSGNLSADIAAGYIRKIRPVVSTALPLMDGTASAGSSLDYASGNHVHPTDTTRVAVTTYNAHVTNYSNPHRVTVQQASTQQGAANTVMPSGQRIYYLSATSGNLLLTYNEALALFQGTATYMGQIKYGAMTVADMNSIPTANPNYNLSVGDSCGCQATQLTYTWDGTTWNAQAHGTDHINEYYDMLFWYGTWIDGQTYTGDVSARITCKDATTPLFDLIVWSDYLNEGSVTLSKLNANVVDNVTIQLTPQGLAVIPSGLVSAGFLKTTDVAFEVGTKVLTNTLALPFNNSASVVSLATPRSTTNYVVTIQSAVASDGLPVGDVTVSGKTINSFNLRYSGTASSVTVQYVVTWGVLV